VDAVDDATSDRDLLAALYVADYEKLVRLARLLGDPADAEDVVQSAFVRVYRRSGRLRDPDLAGAYLRQTVVNLVRSGWRRRQVARRHASPAADVTAEVDVAGQMAMRAALAALPRRQREAVVLRYYADLSEAQAADAMGVSVGSVKAYTSRGLARLGEILQGSTP
jgi:RNA polymerase sigma-70 factor (sigma-E family)